MSTVFDPFAEYGEGDEEENGYDGRSLALPEPYMHYNCRCVLHGERAREIVLRSILADIFEVPHNWAIEYAAVLVARIPSNRRGAR